MTAVRDRPQIPLRFWDPESNFPTRRLLALAKLIGLVLACLTGAYFCLWIAHFPQMDFQVYRMGGQHVFTNGLYASNVTALGRRLLFTYPPAAAALFWPFSFLTTHFGQVLWDAVDLFALVALIAISIAASRQRSVVRSDWVLGFTFLAPIAFVLWPVRYDLNLGQINILLTLMIMVDLTVGVSFRSYHLPSGVLVGLAAAIKLTPLVFIAYLIATRQWRVARNAIMTFGSLSGAMFAVAPSASWDYFTGDAYDVSRIGDQYGIGNQTVLAFLHRSHLSVPAPVADLFVVVVLGAGILLAVRAYRQGSSVLAVLTTATTGLMVSPVSWPHHYVWIVPALIWLAIGVDRPTRGAWWALAGATVFVILPPIRLGAGAIWFAWENAYVVVSLIFLGLVGVLIRNRSVRAAGASRSQSMGGRHLPVVPTVGD